MCLGALHISSWVLHLYWGNLHRSNLNLSGSPLEECVIVSSEQKGA